MLDKLGSVEQRTGTVEETIRYEELASRQRPSGVSDTGKQLESATLEEEAAFLAEFGEDGEGQPQPAALVRGA